MLYFTIILFDFNHFISIVYYTFTWHLDNVFFQDSMIALCRIDGDISYANTKVYGMVTPFFQVFFLFLGLEQTSENTGGIMKKKRSK